MKKNVCNKNSYVAKIQKKVKPTGFNAKIKIEK